MREGVFRRNSANSQIAKREKRHPRRVPAEWTTWWSVQMTHRATPPSAPSTSSSSNVCNATASQLAVGRGGAGRSGAPPPRGGGGGTGRGVEVAPPLGSSPPVASAFATRQGGWRPDQWRVEAPDADSQDAPAASRRRPRSSSPRHLVQCVRGGSLRHDFCPQCGTVKNF